MSKKEEIILATLDLASEYGLKSLSMSQIAERVGIKKPSLYNHFESKEMLLKEMYEYIRNKSRKKIYNTMNSEYFADKSAYDILCESVVNYKNMVLSDEMLNFYKVIYSERSISNEASQILIEETNKMVNATKFLFKMLNETNKLFVDNIDIASISFSMTIHSLIDYELDCIKTNNEYNKAIIKQYIKWFCDTYRKDE